MTKWTKVTLFQPLTDTIRVVDMSTLQLSQTVMFQTYTARSISLEDCLTRSPFYILETLAGKSDLFCPSALILWLSVALGHLVVTTRIEKLAE